MAESVVVKVPPLRHTMEEEKAFHDGLVEALEKGNAVILDFNNYQAVSSMVLGAIMFQMKTRRDKIRFTNVSLFMYESLKMLVGNLADELVPVKPEK